MTTSRSMGLPRRVRLADWNGADQIAWRAACARGVDILDDTGLAAGWRGPTRRKVEHACGYFLGFVLDHRGLPLRSVAESATDSLLRDYVTWLEPRVAPATRLGLFIDLGEYLKVAWPEHSRDSIKRIETSLRWRCVPSRDKRSRLVPVGYLVRLGQALMATMYEMPFADPRLPLARYRDGLAIAFLALMPLRIRAFASLQLDKHVTQEGSTRHISVTPDLSKTKRPWSADCPAALAPAFGHYTSDIRPRLLQLHGRWHQSPGQALWISIDGSPSKPKALGEAIVKRTTAAFGHAISPHLFRDCAATTLALAAPEHVALATPLPGHATPRMTTKHYNQAKSVDAGRRHINALRALGRSRRDDADRHEQN